MATSHVQPLLLLLASLFFLPTLRAVEFEYCNKSGYSFGKVYSVDISPDPIGPEDYELSITVFGFIKESIGKGVIDVYAKSENITDLVGRFDLCAMGLPCPIANTIFELPLPGVFKDVLEGDYKYVVSLLDEAVKNPEEAIPRLCIDFTLPTSAIRMVSA